MMVNQKSESLTVTTMDGYHAGAWLKGETLKKIDTVGVRTKINSNADIALELKFGFERFFLFFLLFLSNHLSHHQCLDTNLFPCSTNSL